VSTPNVIATNGYFSTLNISTWSGSTVNLVTLNASQGNVSNLSTSNISNASLISTSTLAAYITNVSTQNSCLVSTSTLYSTYGYVSNLSASNLSATIGTVTTLNGTTGNITNLSVSNLSVQGDIYIDNQIAAITGKFEVVEVKNAAEVVQYSIDQVGSTIKHNISNSGVTAIDFMRLNSSLATLNSSQCYFWNPINTSGTYTSVLQVNTCANISNLSTSNASFTNVSINSICGPTGRFENFSCNNLSANNISLRTTTIESVTIGNITVSQSLTANQSVTVNMSTISVSSISVSNFSAVNGSFTALTAGSLSFTNLSLDSISVSVALTATSGTITRLNSTSTFVSNLSASNASITGRITVSNISTTSISATGRINADNIRTVADVIAVGNVSGLGVYGGAMYTSSIFISNHVSTNTISCSSISNISTYTSQINACNISVTNLSLTTVTGTTANFSTTNISTLTVTNAITNMCVSYLYTSVLTLTQSGTTSMYGQVQYGAARMIVTSQGPLANSVAFANSGNVRFEISASGVSSYVGLYSSNAYFSTLATSTFSPANITTTTMTATTVNASTGNFSIINACNTSINSISELNNIKSGSLLSMTNDGLYLYNTYASVGGSPYQQFNYWLTSVSANDQGLTLYCDETRKSVVDGGNLDLVFKQADVTQATNTSTNGWTFTNKINSSYQTNLSKLAVSNLSVSTLTISSITITTVNASTLNGSTVASDTANIITQNSSTLNASTINSSTITNASGTFITMTNNTIYSSIINVSRINNTSSFITNLSVSTINASTAVFTNASSTSMRSTSYYGTHMSVSNICVSYMSITTANVSNVCASYVSAYDMTTETFNASAMYCDTAYPGYIVNTGGGNFSQITYFDNISVDKINSTITVSNPSDPFSIISVSNDAATGIRLPNYIDGTDLTSGVTIGYNQTTGFINVCRACRFYGNILTDSNINGIAATDSITLGNNTTTGNLRIGNTDMTGNVCITTDTGNINFSTAGDVTFNSDRRSTWNTSNLIKASTQLGSYYANTAVNNFTKINTGNTFTFNPTNNNVSLTTFPVGLYLVQVHGFVRAQTNVSGSFNGVVSTCSVGYCYGATYPAFSSGNTNRQQLLAVSGGGLTNTSGIPIPLVASGMLNLTITGQYIGGYIAVNMTTAATAGNIFAEIQYVAVTKIA
jgi:hypothetical protein